MATTNHARNATLGALLAAGMLATGTITPAAFADDTSSTPSPSPTISTNTNTVGYQQFSDLRDAVQYVYDQDNTGNRWTNDSWTTVKPRITQALDDTRDITEVSGTQDINTAYASLKTSIEGLVPDYVAVHNANASTTLIPRKDWAGEKPIPTGQTPQSVYWGYAPSINQPGLGGEGTITKLDGETFTPSDKDFGTGDTITKYRLNIPEIGLDNVMEASQPTGETVTAGDTKTPFTYENGTWTARIDMTLTANDKFPTDSITLSDGTTVPVTGNMHMSTVDKDGTAWRMATLTLNGRLDSNGTPFTIILTGERAYDTRVTLSITQTPAQGDPIRLPVPGADEVNAANLKDTYTLDMLPHTQVGDQYTLNIDPANQADVNVGDITAAIGDNGERRLTAPITYTDAAGKEQTKTVTVTIPFDKAKPVVGNPDAALDGFLVNGKPLEGFTPDQLAYTITAKADEKITVKPVAREGQTVKASDIRQTAWTTTQEWTVEKNGQTRTYTVTLVREHSPEQATADDKFNPADPIAQASTVEPDSPADTTLASHGYVLNGEYHTVDKDDYTIPEGAAFSYDSKIGQAIKVGVEKTGGMTYKYKVGVLAPDQKTYSEHTYTVTYLTAATHKAELTGINVDGKPIAGFNPDTHEYTVEVKNPEKWTITPQFDKSTGMSVSTHKDGDKATITVSSADNLNTVTYTVTVKQKMKLVEKLALANTGTTAVTAIIAALVLIAAGGIVGFVTMRRRKPETTDTPSHEDTGNTAGPDESSMDGTKPENNAD